MYTIYIQNETYELHKKWFTLLIVIYSAQSLFSVVNSLIFAPFLAMYCEMYISVKFTLFKPLIKCSFYILIIIWVVLYSIRTSTQVRTDFFHFSTVFFIFFVQSSINSAEISFPNMKNTSKKTNLSQRNDDKCVYHFLPKLRWFLLLNNE
jgi:hypothetical protein